MSGHVSFDDSDEEWDNTLDEEVMEITGWHPPHVGGAAAPGAAAADEGVAAADEGGGGMPLPDPFLLDPLLIIDDVLEGNNSGFTDAEIDMVGSPEGRREIIEASIVGLSIPQLLHHARLLQFILGNAEDLTDVMITRIHNKQRSIIMALDEMGANPHGQSSERPAKRRKLNEEE